MSPYAYLPILHLKTADEAGKNHFESFPGEHIRMTNAELAGWLKKYFI